MDRPLTAEADALRPTGGAEPASVAAWRTRLVAGAAIWSGHGRHVMADGWCEALSGVGGTDGNVVFSFSGDPEPVRTVAGLVRHGAVPAVAVLGGEALGWAQVMVDHDLSCVGAVAFMHLASERVDVDGRDGDVRRLRAGDLPEARAVVSAAYAAGSPMPQIALPDEVVDSPTWAAWGLFVAGALASVVTTTAEGDTVGVWSMSTPAALQRRGHGRRLLRGVLPEVTGAGACHVLLYASPSGERLYRDVGFEVIEHWQAWSRARWIPGRA